MKEAEVQKPVEVVIKDSDLRRLYNGIKHCGSGVALLNMKPQILKVIERLDGGGE